MTLQQSSRITWAWVAALSLVLLGCPTDPDDDDTEGDDDTADDDDGGDDDSGDDDGGDDDGGDDDTAPACGFPAAESARIEIGENYVEVAGWSSRIFANLHDGPWPAWMVVTLEAGDCRYLQFEQGLCEPACEMSQFCTAANVCEDYPTGISGGTLTITGLGDDLVIEPDEWYPGNYWVTSGLPADIFAEGDPIGATLGGGDFPAISLQAAGVAPLDTSLAAALWPMVDGGDAELTWTPGSDPAACVRVLINGANNAHGLPLNDLLWCETGDSGSLTIPQVLVEAFPLGSTPEICVGHDCPPSEMIRYRHDEVMVAPGLAELEVLSRVYFGYDHQQ